MVLNMEMILMILMILMKEMNRLQVIMIHHQVIMIIETPLLLQRIQKRMQD